jgi:hypothetical protein
METACQIMQRKLPSASALVALRDCAFNLPCSGAGRPDML